MGAAPAAAGVMSPAIGLAPLVPEHGVELKSDTAAPVGGYGVPNGTKPGGYKAHWTQQVQCEALVYHTLKNGMTKGIFLGGSKGRAGPCKKDRSNQDHLG
jgi:hypothetical protein